MQERAGVRKGREEQKQKEGGNREERGSEGSKGQVG